MSRAAMAVQRRRRALSAKPPGGLLSLRRLWRAAGYSAAGLRVAWRREAAFRQAAVLATVAAPLGLWLGRSGVERALLAGSLVLVLIVELLNSAIEAAVDRGGRGWHPLAAAAKDMGSAAELLALLLAALVWSLVLLDRATP